jgi:hypothetical protein
MTTQKLLSDPLFLKFEIITIFIIGFLGYKIGRGKNWARITLLIIFIIGMISYPSIILTEFQTNMMISIVSITQILIQLYVLVILFNGESQEWFKKQKIKTTPNNY